MPVLKPVLLKDTITFETIDLKFEMMYFFISGPRFEDGPLWSIPFQYSNAILKPCYTYTFSLSNLHRVL